MRKGSFSQHSFRNTAKLQWSNLPPSLRESIKNMKEHKSQAIFLDLEEKENARFAVHNAHLMRIE